MILNKGMINVDLWNTCLRTEASFEPELKTCMSFTDKGGPADPNTVFTLTFSLSLLVNESTVAGSDKTKGTDTLQKYMT